jgi:hypothetical protein
LIASFLGKAVCLIYGGKPTALPGVGGVPQLGTIFIKCWSDLACVGSGDSGCVDWGKKN